MGGTAQPARAARSGARSRLGGQGGASRTRRPMIVLDASAALEVLLNDRLAAHVSRRIFDPAESLHAPHLIDVEVAQVLRRIVRKKEMTAERGEQALDDLRQLPLSRYPHSLLLDRIWTLRDIASAYDAAYSPSPKRSTRRCSPATPPWQRSAATARTWKSSAHPDEKREESGRTAARRPPRDALRTSRPVARGRRRWAHPVSARSASRLLPKANRRDPSP